MAQQTNEPKILRIGVIQSGKVIEERLVRKRTPVSVGSDDKNTFVLAGADVPKSWSLFELKGQQYSLVFSDAMDGRVSVETNNVDFASLKAQNLVQKQGDRYRLPLNDSSRGRVQIGSDLTILFHFVAAPPVAAKPELPLAAKDGWVKSIEPWFTGVLTGSFVLHALMTILIFNVDQPPPPSMDELKALIARVTPPKVEIPPPALPDSPTPSEDKAAGTKKEEKKEEESAGEEKKEAKKPKGSAADQARAAEARRRDVQSKIAGKGLLGVIGSKGDGAGALADVFGSGSALGNVSTDVSGTGGVGIAGSGSDVTRRGEGGGGGGGEAAGIGDLGSGGGGSVATGPKKRTEIKPSVQADAINDVDGSIDKRGVSRAIRARAAAFQQCYEAALKTNSKIKGKLVVEFTITDSGAVADARTINDGLGSPEVSKCVIGVLKRIRFPKPDDGEVTISNSFVFQPGG